MGQRKTKPTSAVRVRISRTQSVGKASLKSVTIRTSASGRISQTTAHADTVNEEYQAFQHIDDFCIPNDEAVLNDTSDPVSHSLGREAVADDETKRSPARPVQDWLPFRQTYIEEFLRHDSPGPFKDSLCFHCQLSPGDIRCRDCFGAQLCCSECAINTHSRLPFHRLLRWTGSYFADLTLADIGFRMVIGHDNGTCRLPSSAVKNFTIVDTSGIHTLPICFCECSGAPHRRIQLLRAGWMPASLERPRTAFTFDVLDTFHLLTLQGKISAFDFYYALEHKSDNTGQRKLKDRYEQFLVVIRIWRHLKMLKRSGRGHDPEGVASTLFGECAVECPACPHPGKNLPEGWEDAPEAVRWIYALILTIDANFRLKLKDKGILNDPALGDGWAHWVASEPYHAYVKKYGHQIEPNLCQSNLRAVNHAGTKDTPGLISTGAGGCMCARHTCVRKNGLGDLQKGERYANMDFVVFFGLIGASILSFVFSYDIVCQWSRKLEMRMGQLPQCMRIGIEQLRKAKFVLPKFHIYNHGIKCQLNYSLNFLKWSARTNGEDPERWWAHINPVSMSTREMGAGARHDTIDDHAAAWNWRKIVKFGYSLLSQLEKAVEMYKKHQAAFEQFNATFELEVLDKWEQMVMAWDADITQPNPYEEPAIGTTIADVQLELAREEAADAEIGCAHAHEVTASRFLSHGLELEEQQRVLRWQISKRNITTLQAAELQEKRNTLGRRIDAWREIQTVYMPGAVQLLESSQLPLETSSHSQSSASQSTNKPETNSLWLPSSMPSSLHATGCVPGLVAKETKLRIAQADDALNDIRRQLRISATLLDFKKSNIGGTSQRMGTRVRTLMTRFHDKTHRAARRYDAALRALSALDPNGTWTNRLKRLDHSKDLRLPRRDMDDEPSEGRRELSWIWLVPRDDGNRDDEEEYNESMRIEWAKSKARAERWKEEIKLLVEEMCRVIAYFAWKVQWWSIQRHRRTDAQMHIRDGAAAYAVKQTMMYKGMARSFATDWYPYLVSEGLPVEWPAEYIPVSQQQPLSDMDVD